MAGNAGAIRAGKAYVEAMLNDEKLRKGLTAAEVRLKAFGKGLEDIGKKMVLAGSAIAVPMLAAAKSWATAGGELSEMSERTGVSASKLSALSYAATQSGTDLEGLEGGLRKMSKSLTEASQGSKAQVDALGRLGLTYADLKGKAPDEQFKILADRIDAVEDPTIKAGLAMDIFGKNATALVPLMTGGRAEIERLTEKARGLGIVMSDEAAEKAHQLEKALNDVGRVCKSTWGALAGALSPVLKQASQDLIGVVQNAKDWINANQKMVVMATASAVALAGLGAGFTGLGLVIKNATIAIKALSFLCTPAGWITAATAGVIALAGGWRMVAQAVREAKEDLEGAREAGDIDAEKNPVAKTKLMMEAANAERMRAMDAANANPGDKDALKWLDQATQGYLYARRAYQRELAAAGPTKGKPADADYDAIQKRNDLEAKALEDLKAARIEAIDSAAERETAKIEAAYAKKIEEAKKAGASTQALEDARETEIATVHRRRIQDGIREGERLTREAAKKEQEIVKDQADKRQELEDEIAKAGIESTMTGKEREIALLEIERQKALRAAKEAGIPEERVNQLFGLRTAAIGAGLKRNEEVVGTFSGEAASQLGPSTAAQKIAATAQQQVDILNRVEQILRRMENNGGMIVQ